MKILWLNPLFPYPLFSGGQVRAYHLIKNLAQSHQVALFSFLRPDREQGPVKELQQFCFKVKTFKGRKTWTARNILLAGLSHLPFTVTHFYGHRELEKAIREELNREKYDLLHFESFYLSPYLRSDFGLPTVLGNENIEYLIYQRFAQQKKLPFKWLFDYDVWKMRRYEEAAWRRADLNLAVSEVDAQRIEAVTGQKCSVIPNGVDVRYFESFKSLKKKEGSLTLLFLGDFKYFANKNALKLLVGEIWPRVKAKMPEVRLWLVGKNPDQFAKSLVGKDIIIDDQIDDVRQAYSQADVLTVPLRLASGTNIKLLEAMAMGLPVVTTSAGIEGIRAEKTVVVQDEPEAMAMEIVKLLADKKRCQKLGEAGQTLVKKRYDWTEISKKLITAYQELL